MLPIQTLQGQKSTIQYAYVEKIAPLRLTDTHDAALSFTAFTPFADHLKATFNQHQIDDLHYKAVRLENKNDSLTEAAFEVFFSVNDLSHLDTILQALGSGLTGEKFKNVQVTKEENLPGYRVTAHIQLVAAKVVDL